jgi:hypothetical protein
VCFQILFFCPAIPSLAPHGLAQDTSPPCTVPSEAYAHAGGLGARLFREGRETAYASQFSKKKIMKTTKKLMKGLLADTANLVPAETAPAAQSAVEKKDSRLPIDTEARKKNRTLPTPKVLELLKNSAIRVCSISPRLSASGFGLRSARRPRRSCGRCWRSLVSIGTASGRHGSTLAAHFVCAVSKTRTKSMRAISPPIHAPLDSHHETEQTPPAVAAA